MINDLNLEKAKEQVRLALEYGFGEIFLDLGRGEWVVIPLETALKAIQATNLPTSKNNAPAVISVATRGIL